MSPEKLKQENLPGMPEDIKPQQSEVGKIAFEAGSQRLERTGKFFERTKDRFVNAAKYIAGSPEAAMHLGKQVVRFSKEKAVGFLEAIGSRATSLWERIVSAKDRLVEKVSGAKDRLMARVNGVKERTTSRIGDLGRKAKIFSLSAFVAPIERKLEQICSIPARIREFQAGLAEAKAARKQEKIDLLQAAAEAKIAILQEKINAVQATYNEKIEALGGMRNEASGRASELRLTAELRRSNARQTFGKARSAIESLKAAA